MSKFDGLLAVTTKKKEGKRSPRITPTENGATARTPGKRRDPRFTQITAYIKKDTHESVMRAIYRRQELSELIEELLEKWIKAQK